MSRSKPAPEKPEKSEPIGFAHLTSFSRTAGTSQLRAAEELQAAQATISRHVDRIQEYFGGQLFAHGSSGQLSIRGMIALKPVLAALVQFEDARARLDPEQPEIALGYMPALENIVHRALRLEGKEATSPSFDVRFMKLTISDMIQALTRGDIDVAISYVRPEFLTRVHTPASADIALTSTVSEAAEISVVPEITETIVAQLPFVLAIPEHAYIDNRVSMHALKDLVYAHSPARAIIAAGDEWLANQQLDPRRRVKCEYGSEILGYARSGRGFGILPSVWQSHETQGAKLVLDPTLQLTSQIAVYSLQHVTEIATRIADELGTTIRNVLRTRTRS